jgi:hypothetical protein
MILYINQPQFKTKNLKGVAGGLTAIGRGTMKIKIKQENQETTIYAPDCPIRLISPQRLHHQSKDKVNEQSCFTTDENTATLFHGGGTYKMSATIKLEDCCS